MKARLNRLRLWAGVDRPVFFAGLGQGWSLFSGPITIFLITRYFSPTIQGYAYTFGSVTALQMFLELGFSQCIIQFASHEFARLRFGPSGTLEGDAQARSRFISLGRLSLKWYAVLAVLAVIGLGLGGSWFFSTKPDSSVHWVLPWWCACVGVGLTLVLLPVGALLEGCNQVSFVYGLRTVTRVVSAMVGWVAVWGGANLFTGSLMVLSTVLVMAGAYLWRWRELLVELWRAPAGGETISWRREIWPFHWRIAISCVSGYFIFNFFTPVLFYFHGPVVAGQMGVTMSLITSLSALAQSWTVSKGPRFGMLISRREFAELDRLFYRATAQAVGICILGGLALLAGLLVVRGHFAIGARFLDPGPTSLLVLATVIGQIVLGQAIYLRAHKQEPFMILSAVNGLATGCLVALLGCFFGAWGVSLAFAVVQIAVLVWASQVWRNCRRKWHQTEVPGNSNGQE
jgi:O-antigen/teichoic acid export membrane protein